MLEGCWLAIQRARLRAQVRMEPVLEVRLLAR